MIGPRWWTNSINLAYKVRSGFDPGQKLATHYAFDLPSTHVRRPDWDLGALAALEFENAKIYQNLERRVWGSCSLKRLQDPWNHLFFIMATKGPEI